mgnify:FL=1
MLLVYYNINTEVFFLKYVKSYFDNDGRYYEIGYTNQYNHIIVQLFIVDYDNNLISANSYLDYLNDLRFQKRETIKNKLIDRAIGLLNKLK